MRTDHVIEVLEVRTVEPQEAVVDAAEGAEAREGAGLPDRGPAPVLPAPA